jgi:hypothetical protein
MIEVFKLLNGFDIVAPNTFFNRSFTGLRGHEFKLYKSSFCTNLGKFSFSNRFGQDWNSLPQHVAVMKSRPEPPRPRPIKAKAIGIKAKANAVVHKAKDKVINRDQPWI